MPELSSLLDHWGYPAIFGIVTLGNLGLPVPEESVLIVAGYLVWRGHLRLSGVLVVGVISAVAGDNLGYWLWRRYGQTPVERLARWTGVDVERMASMRRFVALYGSLGVFVGRFLPGLRFMAGPLAGATGLGIRPFFVANVLGAAGFVPYSVGLGYAVGYGLGVYVAEIRYAERAAVVAAVMCAVGLAGWRVVRVRRYRTREQK